MKKKSLWSIFTLIYFLLGFINIAFAYLALVCMTLPFLLLIREKKNRWCGGVCPRADYLSFLRFFNVGLKSPSWLLGDKMKGNILMYFCLNMMFIVLSTVAVGQGSMAAIERVRLFIFLEIPREMPQLWKPFLLSPTLSHLAFRLYSVMLSSTILGTVLAVLFKPRSWCAICPVMTLSTNYLKKKKD